MISAVRGSASHEVWMVSEYLPECGIFDHWLGLRYLQIDLVVTEFCPWIDLCIFSFR